jgi:hypothetical protein
MTITYKGIDLEVIGQYERGESEVWYYADGSGHPGTPSEFNIEEVFLQDTEISELLGEDAFAEIESIILEKLEG